MSDANDEKLLNAAQQQVAATLAAAVIAGLGRPVSLNEAIKIKSDFYFSLFPTPGNGRFENWKANFDGDALYT